MLAHEKRKIENFFHPKTIQMFVGKRPSKAEKKQKMAFMLLCAKEPAVRNVVPGRWLIEMDRRFKAGLK
jgi:hypothetical protein